MKKYIFCSMVAVALAFASCAPMEDKDSNDSTILTAEQLKSMSSVTVVQENGKNVNAVICESSAPALIEWYNGVLSSQSSYAELTMFGTGAQTVICRARCADGTMVEAEFPVTIDEFSDKYPVHPAYNYLTNGSSKTWVWDESIKGNAKGYGGYKGGSGDEFLTVGGMIWWGHKAAELGEEGGNAYMVWSLSGTAIESYGDSGALIHKGQFNLANIDKVNAGWSVGTIITTPNAILSPFANDGQVPTQFEVMQLDEDRLVLSCPPADGSSWSEFTYWSFKAK